MSFPELVPSRNLSSRTNISCFWQRRNSPSIAYAYDGEFLRCQKQLILVREDKFLDGTSSGKDMIRDKVFLAEAKIDLVWGNYRDGLKKADQGWRGMVRHLGRRNVHTLESSKLRA